MLLSRLPRVLSILTLALITIASDVQIQRVQAQQDDRVFGGGRFLKRIRDEINNAAKSKAEKNKREKADKAKKAEAKKQPTPASRNGNTFGLNRTPMPSTNNRPLAAREQDRSNDFDPYPNRQSRQLDISRLPAGITRSAPAPTLGFGMLVTQKGDRLVVSQLDPKGNARKAGIKVGDEIVSGGGVEFTSVEEFNEISDILKAGDQLEFEISRRGKGDKLMISFGEDEDDPEALAAGRAPGPARPAINTQNNFSFVPEPDSKTGSGLRSVIDSPQQPAQRTGNLWQGTSSERAQVTELRSIIQRQQFEINRLRQELQRAQQQRQPVGLGRRLPGPSLSGPTKSNR